MILFGYLSLRLDWKCFHFKKIPLWHIVKMYVMKNFLVGILLIGCLSACSKEAELKDRVFFSERRESVRMSEIISDYSLVKLETKEKNLIQDASMIRIWNDRIYILDCFGQHKTVWVYDMNGRYVGELGTFGQGPGEYIMPNNLLVDEQNNRILVKDIARNRLLYYDAETMKCVKEVDIPFYSDCLEYLSEGKLIWYVGSGCANEGDLQKHIQITDMDLNVINSCIPRLDFPKRGRYNVMTYFHSYNGQVYFHHPFSDDIYTNKADTVVRQYTLSMNGLNFPSMEYMKDNQQDFIKHLGQDGYIQYYEILENDNKLLCYFGQNDKRHVGVYDKRNGKGYYVEAGKIEDDLGILKYVRPKTVYKSRFVSVVYVDDLEEITESSIIYPFLKDEQESGNPLILLYK